LAQVLVVYERTPFGPTLSTYEHNLASLRRCPGHEVFFLNTARTKLPRYLKSLRPDLVVYHYTFLATRMNPAEFAREVELVEFTRELPCRKAIVAQDEQARSDLVSQLIEDFGVTHVFSPASPPEWPQIYEGADFDNMHFETILTGYVDDATVRRIEKRARAHHDRSIDIGYRSWYMQPFYGRHGQIKQQIAEVFQEGADRFGLVSDISTDFSDALWGDKWFDFLLRCKYTVGVEGGTSVFDRDGSVAERTKAWMQKHPDATFDEIEAACFPGLDGQFGYRLLGPRHLEAVMTRTCQVLVEGTYGGALEADTHYIPLKRDFSNLDEVLQIIKDDKVRAEMVERAYQDVIASGDWSYEIFADKVINGSIKGVTTQRTASGYRVRLRWNRIEERLWWIPEIFFGRRSIRTRLREIVASAVGEERLWRFMIRLHNVRRRLQGRPPLSLEHPPTTAPRGRSSKSGPSERS
jgi:hypothetical protein